MVPAPFIKGAGQLLIGPTPFLYAYGTAQFLYDTAPHESVPATYVAHTADECLRMKHGHPAMPACMRHNVIAGEEYMTCSKHADKQVSAWTSVRADICASRSTEVHRHRRNQTIGPYLIKKGSFLLIIGRLL